jgi:hypothetical protein
VKVNESTPLYTTWDQNNPPKMNLAMRELRNGFLLEGSMAAAGHSEQVYRPTTSEISSVSNIVPAVTETRYTQTLTESPEPKSSDIFHSSSSDMSKKSKETVDMFFDNIHYTVSLGFRKGECAHNANRSGST